MTSSPGPAIAPHPPLARLLAALSIVLLVVFLAAAITTAIPAQLLDPAWQLQLTTALINYATLPLVGALLLPLALVFEPENRQLRGRWVAFRRWALAAALGFLLLVPLQITAAWRLHQGVTVSRQQQSAQSAQKLSEMRKAINSASTPQELQARVQQLFGTTTGLSPSQLRTPMPELRQQLLARAEQVSALLLRQSERQANRKPDLLVKESIRIVISALAYAIGFAYIAGLLPRDQPIGARTRVVDEDYFEKLAE